MLLHLERQKGILKLKSLLVISSGTVLFLLRDAFFAAVTQSSNSAIEISYQWRPIDTFLSIC